MTRCSLQGKHRMSPANSARAREREKKVKRNPRKICVHRVRSKCKIVVIQFNNDMNKSIPINRCALWTHANEIACDTRRWHHKQMIAEPYTQKAEAETKRYCSQSSLVSHLLVCSWNTISLLLCRMKMKRNKGWKYICKHISWMWRNWKFRTCCVARCACWVHTIKWTKPKCTHSQTRTSCVVIAHRELSQIAVNGHWAMRAFNSLSFRMKAVSPAILLWDVRLPRAKNRRQAELQLTNG